MIQIEVFKKIKIEQTRERDKLTINIVFLVLK